MNSGLCASACQIPTMSPDRVAADLVKSPCTHAMGAAPENKRVFRVPHEEAERARRLVSITSIPVSIGSPVIESRVPRKNDVVGEMLDVQRLLKVSIILEDPHVFVFQRSAKVVPSPIVAVQHALVIHSHPVRLLTSQIGRREPSVRTLGQVVETPVETFRYKWTNVPCAPSPVIAISVSRDH